MLNLTPVEFDENIPYREPSIFPLDVDGLVFERNGARIIDGIALRIEPAGCTAIMGYNGAGKSVLIRLLHGLLTPSAGTLRWTGNVGPDEVARRQSMVFQAPVLLRRSVEANVRYALSKRGFNRKEQARRLEAILEQTNLLKLRRRPASVLSAGERQRVALCRALAVEPEVIFLDEPTAALDPAATMAIENILQRAIRDGRKLIMVSQSVGQVQRMASDVIFVHRGRITEHTPIDEFSINPRSDAARAFINGEII
jgi:tungstate transport system ATP-binding protein